MMQVGSEAVKKPFRAKQLTEDKKTNEEKKQGQVLEEKKPKTKDKLGGRSRKSDLFNSRIMRIITHTPSGSGVRRAKEDGNNMHEGGG